MSRPQPRDRRMLIAATALALAASAALGPARAAGDGLPVPGGVDTTHAGVLSPDGTQRYLALPQGGQGGQTVVERIDARNGALQQSATIDGQYVIPGVTVDGDTSGLAQNERSLVLIRPRAGFPQRQVLLAVLSPETLQVRRNIRLQGDFSFDAISPDGRIAYLVQYTDPRNPSDYRLRRLRLSDGRLLPGSLLPENDPEEEMRGLPMSRVAGPGGSWQYTLYDGGTVYRYGKPGEPFVHALDTVGERTLCIDLDWIRPGRVDRIDLRMSADGSEVEVVDPIEGVVGRIDTATGEAREVSEPFGATTAEGGSGGRTLGIGVAIGSIAAGLGLIALLVRRRRPTGPAVDGEIA